jgi:hypothetical protein
MRTGDSQKKRMRTDHKGCLVITVVARVLMVAVWNAIPGSHHFDNKNLHTVLAPQQFSIKPSGF